MVKTLKSDRRPSKTNTPLPLSSVAHVDPLAYFWDSVGLFSAHVPGYVGLSWGCGG